MANPRKRVKHSPPLLFLDDVGKVGRRTGVTLPDTGERDEYGMEPQSGIFDSPYVEATDQEKSLAPDKTPTRQPPLVTPRVVNKDAHNRQSPRTTRPTVPQPQPATAVSPASPVSKARQSRAKRPTSGLAEVVTANVVESIETNNPFRPRNTLRRSPGARQSPAPPPLDNALTLEDYGPAEAEKKGTENVQEAGDDEGTSLVAHDKPIAAETSIQPDRTETEAAIPLDKVSEQLTTTLQESLDDQLEQTVTELADKTLPDQPDQTDRVESSPNHSKAAAAAESINVVDKADNTTEPAPEPEPDYVPLPLDDEQGTVEWPTEEVNGTTNAENPHIVPSIEEEMEEPSADVVEPPKAKPSRKRKAPAEAKSQAPRGKRAKTQPEPDSDSPGKSKPPQKGNGPKSNVTLREMTPSEEAIATTRSGRPVIKPLQYWANEHRVWVEGECQGIIRAEINEQAPKPGRKAAGRSKKKGGKTQLAPIAEEDAPQPEDWEQDGGVYECPVVGWDTETQTANPEALDVQEIGFSAASLRPNESANAEFSYTKMVALSFFGFGYVELPPQGFKRVKNSKNKIMAFNVHAGKVVVGVGSQNNMNEFAVSKGGAFFIPRGNNYFLVNESRTTTAKLFFSQASESREGNS
ncbi:hypothetical protein K470DRAFT_270037 [Piedraia hortae CBS 480.64]|uniref:Mif2/CENP-C cupin domain-containing protein n=1 Tax=Piedraia hortae CBS 480.64 TaxID=1314780 RepID=A0A6A7C104_9PEZI|nr:hypothetical protein K470DRAFT_270037 [Piedraia hortae CBS 480.64]